MTTIKCVKCGKPFPWDESEQVAPGGGIVAPHTPGAVRVPALCTHCQTANYVWVSKARTEDDVEREE